MKKYSVVIGFLLIPAYVFLTSDVDGPAHHGHGDITGATTATIGHCQVGTCHGGNNPLTMVQLQVLDTTTMLPVTTYKALQTYLVTITGDATGVSTTLPGFGFQVSAVLGDHTLAGSYTIPSALASAIHTFPCGATTVVEHSLMLRPDTTGINKYSCQFYWTAPAAFSDSVTFYYLLNAVNGDGNKTGDYPNAGTPLTLYENPSDEVAQVQSQPAGFSVFPVPANTVLNVFGKEPIKSVVIKSVDGKTVYTNGFDAAHVQVDVSKLPSGNYVACINGVENLKFVKN